MVMQRRDIYDGDVMTYRGSGDVGCRGVVAWHATP
jgi:hypothetical protein